MVHHYPNSEQSLEQTPLEHGATPASSTGGISTAALVVRAVPFTAQEARELAEAYVDLDLDVELNL